MKKRLFALAAAALAVTMAFGFAACGNNDDKTDDVTNSENTQQTDNSNTQQSDSTDDKNGTDDNIDKTDKTDETEEKDKTDETDKTDEKPQPDDSVLTEEQWKKAFSATHDSPQLEMDSVWETTTLSKSGDTVISKTEEVMNGSIMLDSNKCSFYQYVEDTQKRFNGSEEVAEERYYKMANYREAIDTEQFSYNYNKNTKDVSDLGQWTATATKYDSAAEAKSGLVSYMEEARKDSFFVEEMSATINGETVTGTLDKLFAAFTYDESTHGYSAENLTMVSNGYSYDIKIFFKDGLIFSHEDHVEKASSFGDNQTLYTAEIKVAFTYGKDIIIPKEAKDALAAAQAK